MLSKAVEADSFHVIPRLRAARIGIDAMGVYAQDIST
jgi:hypothetical protein